VIFLPFHDQPGAMLIAGVAFQKAIGAGLGALAEVGGVFGMGLVGRDAASSQSRQTGRPGA